MGYSLLCGVENEFTLYHKGSKTPVVEGNHYMETRNSSKIVSINPFQLEKKSNYKRWLIQMTKCVWFDKSIWTICSLVNGVPPIIDDFRIEHTLCSVELQISFIEIELVVCTVVSGVPSDVDSFAPNTFNGLMTLITLLDLFIYIYIIYYCWLFRVSLLIEVPARTPRDLWFTNLCKFWHIFQPIQIKYVKWNGNTNDIMSRDSNVASIWRYF